MKLKHAVASMLAAGILLGVVAQPAFAGPYGDTLAKCLVKSTTTADKSTLVQWIFTTAALHPDVRRLSSATDAERGEMNKKIATLLEMLLTESCVNEARAALKHEGIGTMESSFAVLGQVASRELFSNPGVAAGMAEFGKHLNEKKVQRALGGAR